MRTKPQRTIGVWITPDIRRTNSDQSLVISAISGT